MGEVEPEDNPVRDYYRDRPGHNKRKDYCLNENHVDACYVATFASMIRNRNLSAPPCSAESQDRAINSPPFVSITLFSDKAISILINSCELLDRCLRSQVVRRPALLQRMNIAVQVIRGRPNELHRLNPHG